MNVYYPYYLIVKPPYMPLGSFGVVGRVLITTVYANSDTEARQIILDSLERYDHDTMMQWKYDGMPLYQP